MRQRRQRRRFGTFLLLMGVTVAAVTAWWIGYSQVEQWRLNRTFGISGRRQGLPSVRLEIPRIHVQAVLVEGTTDHQLARGPAHFTGTALPGEIGNCAIAGHRNVYGSWFKDLDRLRAGDLVRLRTPSETYTYHITHSSVVPVEDTSVLLPTEGSTLTLVTCTAPKTERRLVVFGEKS